MLPQCVWDLLPFTFLFELYKSWAGKNCPSGKLLGYKTFIKDLRRVLPEYPEWEEGERQSKNRMNKPERLIIQYDLDDWKNPLYNGNDWTKRALPRLNEKYRGLARVKPAASQSDDDDNDDD